MPHYFVQSIFISDRRNNLWSQVYNLQQIMNSHLSSDGMKTLKIILILILILLARALGQQPITFMEKYKEEIQKHLMTGHEEGWQHCDMLTAKPSLKGVPQMSMSLEKIKTLNIKSAFSFSQCLLVNYHISSEASLSDLLHFGFAAIQLGIRLALVLKLESGITLDIIKNTTKIPFLVAAEIDGGKEQFLCPVVGVSEPRLEKDLCAASYASYKKKRLVIALRGFLPDFVLTSNGTIDGTGIRLIDMLGKQLNFLPHVILPNSLKNALFLVGI